MIDSMGYKKAISASKDNVTIKIHAMPNSSISVFPAGYNTWRDSIEIKLINESKDNKANREIIQLIATFFTLPTEDISIISGKKTRDKIIALSNVSLNNIYKKLGEAMNGL
jgi:uncharacterized protein (TIGR00251 family)